MTLIYRVSYRQFENMKFAIFGVKNDFDGVLLKLLSAIFPIITRITAICDDIWLRKAEGNYFSIGYQHILKEAGLDKMLNQWDSG